MWSVDARSHQLKTAKIAHGKSKNKAVEDKQAVVLIKTAQDLIASGVLGTGEFTVSIAGHANVNHASADGAQNDYLMISIQKVPAAAEG